MEILTREGRNSWFPSGVYFSRVNRVFVLSFVPAFLLRMSMSSLFAPCFNHFQSDSGNGKCYNQPTVGTRRDEEGDPSSWGSSRAHSKGYLCPAMMTCYWGWSTEEHMSWMTAWKSDGVPSSTGNKWWSYRGRGCGPRLTPKHSC